MQANTPGMTAKFPSVADVRFAPKSDRLLRRREMTLSANTDQSALHQIGRLVRSLRRLAVEKTHG